jgi:RNA polymerase sigma-70 factor (ECF subfamily)
MAETTARIIQQWVERYQHDDAARDMLIALACERLRQLTRHMLGGFPGVRRWEETDDVLNAAMLRLCRALAEVRPATAKDFLGLAALQIRRELIDLARRYARPGGPVAKQAAESAAEPAETTLDPVRLAAWQDFHQAVDALPAEEREVFDLLWYQELSQPEAAQTLGVALITIKRRWQSARRRLYDLLQGELPF